MNKNRSTSAAVSNRPQSASSVLSPYGGRSNSNLKSHRLFTAEDRPIFSNSNENSPVKPIEKPSEPVKVENKPPSPQSQPLSTPLKVSQPIPVQSSLSPTKSPTKTPAKKPLFIITAPKTNKTNKTANLLSPTTTSMTNPVLARSTKFKTMSADAALKINETILKNIEDKKNMNRPKIKSNERSSSAPVVKNSNKPLDSQLKKKKTTKTDNSNVNETKSVVSSVSTRTTVSIYSAKGDTNKKNAFNRLYTVKNMDTINELKKKYEDELMRPEKKLTRV